MQVQKLVELSRELIKYQAFIVINTLYSGSYSWFMRHWYDVQSRNIRVIERTL